MKENRGGECKGRRDKLFMIYLTVNMLEVHVAVERAGLLQICVVSCAGLFYEDCCN